MTFLTAGWRASAETESSQKSVSSGAWSLNAISWSKSPGVGTTYRKVGASMTTAGMWLTPAWSSPAARR